MHEARYIERFEISIDLITDTARGVLLIDLQIINDTPTYRIALLTTVYRTRMANRVIGEIKLAGRFEFFDCREVQVLKFREPRFWTNRPES